MNPSNLLFFTNKKSPKRSYIHRVALCCKELLENSHHVNKKLMVTAKEIKEAARKYNVRASRIDKIINCKS